MAFDWKEFLDLARALQTSFGNIPLWQAAGRLAVSRAYYAAFGHTWDHAEKHFGIRRSRTGRDHKQIREYLGQQGPEWKEVADKLGDLHEWRKRCDYEDEDLSSNLSIMVANAISAAEDIINRM